MRRRTQKTDGVSNKEGRGDVLEARGHRNLWVLSKVKAAVKERYFPRY